MLALPLCLLAGASGAWTIDFENLPEEHSAEGIIIIDQFQPTLGVTFGVYDKRTGEWVKSGPLMAAIGPPTMAFVGPNNSNDDVIPDHRKRVGQFFLTDSPFAENKRRQMVLSIAFDLPQDAIAMDILDIDFDEKVTIRAFGDWSGQTLLDSITLSARSPQTGDGRATPIAIQRRVPDILRIDIDGERRQRGVFGLAIDNLDISHLPAANGGAPPTGTVLK